MTAATLYLDLPGGRLAYDDRGHGPLILCVPGMGDVRQSYRFLAPALADAGYRVVTVDLRGHGESSADWPVYTPEDVGADIVALLRHLDAGPATVIGVSLAAGAAVWAAAEAPDLVRALVLIGPFVRDVPVSPLLRIGARLLLARPWAARAWAAWYRKLYPGRQPDDLDDHLRLLRTMLGDPRRLAAVRRIGSASKAGCEARIPEVRQPALVVMGTADPDFPDPEAEARLVAARLGGTVHLAPGAGHYPHAEQPGPTAEAITAFCQQHHRVA